ncbi:hypothetical protein BDFB_006361 [Asbolus verrucosus]|uniref:Uncharacterized protein n=1 Tax=Asbolus verrucosus TaxID=1661398 RepID=A0A482VJR1_ASBVE|nr:hypothetical protein BDFB_006361 [Asbolus verrucosus]
MMVPLTIIVATFLVQLTWGYNEEMYPLSENFENSYLYPEEIQEDNDFDIRRRNNNNFLRFGRSGNNDFEYDDYNEDFARPTRSGKTEKNDHFIRFGRSKQDFLRFGRDQYRGRNSNYLRFGRNIPNEEKRRGKRDTYSSDFKRSGSNFLRFGRNSNFLRFGRNNEMSATADPDKIRQESPLIQLLSELVENIKKEQSKAIRAV